MDDQAAQTKIINHQIEKEYLQTEEGKLFLENSKGHKHEDGISLVLEEMVAWYNKVRVSSTCVTPDALACVPHMRIVLLLSL